MRASRSSARTAPARRRSSSCSRASISPAPGASCSTDAISMTGTRTHCAERIGVIFQDFARYQLMVGENVGAGDVREFDDEARWQEAADKGMATPFIARTAGGLSHAARQVVQGWARAVGRAMAEDRAVTRVHAHAARTSWCWTSRPPRWTRRPRPPCSSISVRSPASKIAILISHRFSTVRMADQIVVLERRPHRRARHSRRAAEAGRSLREAVRVAGARLSLATLALARNLIVFR